MWPFESVSGLKQKQFIIRHILEPLIPERRLESYLGFWARSVYRARKPVIIGITGSVGKSTATAMLEFVLSQQGAQRIVGPVGCTVENMNDDWGVAATLLRFSSFLDIPWSYAGRLALFCRVPFRALRLVASRYPKVMVIEFGAGPTSNFERLIAMAPPDLSVVTTIGAAHLEVHNSVEGIIQEKGKLVRAVTPTGLVILGDGHAHVSQLEQMARAPVVKVQGKGIELSRNITRAVCQQMGIPEDVVESALKDFKNPPGRLNRLELAGLTVIDDSWNANPMSMRLGLDTLAEIAGPEQRRLAILGDMLELGEESPRYHEEVSVYARSRADVLIGVGELSKLYSPDAWYDSIEACAEGIEGLVRVGDCVLVKGSHSARMWKAVAKLREIAATREDAISNTRSAQQT